MQYIHWSFSIIFGIKLVVRLQLICILFGIASGVILQMLSMVQVQLTCYLFDPDSNILDVYRMQSKLIVLDFCFHSLGLLLVYLRFDLSVHLRSHHLTWLTEY